MGPLIIDLISHIILEIGIVPFTEELEKTKNFLNNLSTLHTRDMLLACGLLDDLIVNKCGYFEEELFTERISEEKIVDGLLDLFVASVENENDELDDVVEHIEVYVLGLIGDE